MAEVKVVSNGTKEGTKLLLDGMELRNKHWRRLVWEFDFLLEKWTIRIENLVPTDWADPLSLPCNANDELQVDVQLEVDNHKG